MLMSCASLSLSAICNTESEVGMMKGLYCSVIASGCIALASFTLCSQQMRGQSFRVVRVSLALSQVS